MRSSKIACALCCLFLLAPLASASELVGGQDENPADGEAPFTILTRDSPSVDGDQWTLTIEMNQAEYDNGTEFQISTQICTNDGVCDPPTAATADIDERVQTITLTPQSDHTYINWRVKAVYEDGNNTNFPQGSWYTTWSSCWQNNGEYGGVDANADLNGCSAEEESIPGFGAVVALTGLMAAVAVTRRD
jgi:PGF-CTERM protein